MIGESIKQRIFNIQGTDVEHSGGIIQNSNEGAAMVVVQKSELFGTNREINEIRIFPTLSGFSAHDFFHLLSQ